MSPSQLSGICLLSSDEQLLGKLEAIRPSTFLILVCLNTFRCSPKPVLPQRSPLLPVATGRRGRLQRETIECAATSRLHGLSLFGRRRDTPRRMFECAMTSKRGRACRSTTTSASPALPPWSKLAFDQLSASNIRHDTDKSTVETTSHSCTNTYYFSNRFPARSMLPC